MVTVSLKCPPALKRVWTARAKADGFSLSRYLLDRLSEPAHAPTPELPSEVPGTPAPDPISAPARVRESRVRWVRARRWSAEHARLLAAMFQVHAELRQLHRSVSSVGERMTVDDMVWLNEHLSDLRQQVEAAFAQAMQHGGGQRST